ncbi:MAG: nitrate/nitrite transporter NrtS [Chloroflexota bacterium]|nr:nitrate/nitrite transporter NrtS [Chloroflexota bacterium]
MTTNSEAVICGRCGKGLQGALSFAFRPPRRTPDHQGGTGEASAATKCLACSLLHRPMLKRSAMAALVVGSILTALNQGDLLISGQVNSSLYWKIPLTYCVPFLVATYGALSNSRR